MTMREWAENYCVERGMSEWQAKEVLDTAVATTRTQERKERWNDPITDYTDHNRDFLRILAVAINVVVCDYIERDCPDAWFKPFFEGRLNDHFGQDL